MFNLAKVVRKSFLEYTAKASYKKWKKMTKLYIEVEIYRSGYVI